MGVSAPTFFELKAKPLMIWVFALLILFMCNLNALVDLALHPEIPYFDKEHLIVGAITCSVMLLGLCAMLLCAHRLEKSHEKIRQLEDFLSICSKCKKVRIRDLDPMQQNSWQDIDVYIRHNTDTQISHGICPSCAYELYPDIMAEIHGASVS